MPPEERRHNRGRRAMDGHQCNIHEDMDDAVADLESTLEALDKNVVAIQTERNTIKLVGGLICSILTVTGLLVVYIFNSNIAELNKKLDKIEAFVSVASTNDTEVKGRLNNIEYRIQQLEDSRPHR